MAGLGARLFPAFSKLTSDQVNGYLMDQTIMRFATTTARDAAFGGVGEPTLAEGMTAYIDADNTIYTYDGSNWVKMVSASTPVGIELVKSQVIGSGVASVTVSNAFSADHDAYKIILNGITSTNASIQIRLGSSVTGYYGFLVYGDTPSNTVVGLARTNISEFPYIGGSSAGQLASASVEVISPFATTYTRFANGIYQDNLSWGTIQGEHKVSASYTDFTIGLGAGTFSSGVIRVYGYKK
jgi:hypothetical protein